MSETKVAAEKWTKTTAPKGVKAWRSADWLHVLARELDGTWTVFDLTSKVRTERIPSREAAERIVHLCRESIP